MLDEESLKKARTRLAAGRIKAVDKAPYLATAMFSLNPKEVEGFGTFAVDKRWNIYYDPQMCLDWTVDEIATVWLHEVNHVFRDHANRFEATNDPSSKASLFNIAADAAINSDLRDIDAILPDPDKRWYAEANPIYPKWRRNMTAEEMYVIAKSGAGKDEEEKGKGKSEDSDGSNEQDDSDDSNNPSESDDNQEDANSESSNSSDDTDSDDSDDSSDGTSDDEDSEDGSDKSDSSGSSDENSDNNDSGDENSSDDSEDGDSGSSDGSDSGSDGSESDSEASGPDKHANCGSGAHGVPQEYEVNDGSGLDELEAEQMRREVAREIESYGEQYGNVPGGLLREAKDILDPQVDWEDELMSVVRKEIANITGQSDYSYSKPSRRGAQTQFILPSMRQAPPPEIVIVLDTSGSMSLQKELAQALGEMEELIDRAARHSSVGGIRIINCDAGANIPVIVQDLNDFEIVGGGGTDMRIGIKAASELIPKAGIIITMTDGFTPWPKEIPEDNEDALYVALIIDSSKKGSHTKRGWSTTGIPEWMHVIEVQTP